MKRAFVVLGPGGRIRTGIRLMDSETLYQLSYPGAVHEMYRPSHAARKMAKLNRSQIVTSLTGRDEEWPAFSQTPER